MKKTLQLLAGLFTAYTLSAQTLPSSYVQKSVISGLLNPIDFTWTPDGRYLVTQKGGGMNPPSNAFIKIYNPNGTEIGIFYNLTDSVDADGEKGLLGIAVDPAFATNHYVYAYYLYRNSAQTVFAMRVLRLTELNNAGTNPTLIFNQVYATSKGAYPGYHVGGIIGFRPSEPTKLYIQIGELAVNQGDPVKNFANKLINPYGKILRINTDGTIPADNPFYDDGNPATGNDDRIWSYGHRNSFGMCFNPVTDSMYASENGWDKWDEFNIIHKGRNYGWATCEGDHMNGSTTNLCNDPSFVKPLATWGTPLPSVTGCIYYTGTTMPEFNNHILVADNDYGIIYDLTMGNPPAYDKVTSKKNLADIISANGGLTALRIGPADGCIYAMKGGYTSSGEIYRICPKSIGISSSSEPYNELGQNYPNPVTEKTTIEYAVSQPSRVTLTLLDVTGRAIRTLLNTTVQQGKHQLELSDLRSLPNGSYFYKMEVQEHTQIKFSQTKRFIILN